MLSTLVCFIIHLLNARLQGMVRIPIVIDVKQYPCRSQHMTVGFCLVDVTPRLYIFFDGV